METGTQRPPRVLHVSQPVEAGVADVVAMAVTDQHERGWDVSLACPSGALADRAAAAGVRVHLWPARRSPGPGTAGEMVRLGRIVSRVRPDVVHLHSAKAGLAGRLAIRGRRPTVFQPHAWSFHAVTGPIARASIFWERVAAARWTDLLICVSEDEHARGTAAGVRGHSRVVRNGVDTARFRPGDRSAARRGLGIPDVPTVVCVGRICEQKGQDLLLAVWPDVRALVPTARLALVGGGPRLQEWQAGQADVPDGSVSWLGPMDDPTVAYAAADVVVVPSRWEGMALVPLEAMASGRAVVGFDVGGMAETVGTSGCVVASGDTRALARALADRLQDGAGTALAGQQGRVRVVEHFARAQAADGLAAAVRDLRRPLRMSGSLDR